MTFHPYSARVARGGLSDDFSKSQAIADEVRDNIKTDAISRALKWQSLEERGKIRGAQPPQPSQPSILESALGAGASWLMNSDKSPLGDWSSGLRGMFGNKGSNVLSGSEGDAWLGGSYSSSPLNSQYSFGDYINFGGDVPDYGIDLTSTMDFSMTPTNAFNSVSSTGGVNYF